MNRGKVSIEATVYLVRDKKPFPVVYIL